ncbi:MAG TPA: hypothetical protein VGC86_04155 [Afipia sp.]
MTRLMLILVAGVIGFIAGFIAPANAAGYAPLDCGKASSPSDKTICANYDLGQFEARTATLFEIATSLVAMGQRGDIQDAQRTFISQRDACRNDISCIRNVYGTRIKQLEAVVSGIASRGPF